MVTWPGAVSVTRTTFEIKKLFTRSKSSPVQFSMARKTCRRWRAHSVWIELGEPSSTTCPKRSWWKIHTQSPCVPFSNTKSTHGLGVRTWASCPQRSFCGSSPKFGEQQSSLPAFFAEENKKSFCQESPQTKQKSQWNVNEFSIAWNSSNGFPSRRNMSREPSS